MRKNKLGRQTNVIFFGANFNETFPSKNLYKALNVSKPDLVMVQLSPDYLLSNFEQRPHSHCSETNTWNFDSTKYLSQLIRDGHELYPSAKSKAKMHKLLRSEGIVAGRLRQGNRVREEVEEEISQYRNYLTRREPSMRITKKALTAVATWADNHNKPVLLGDIPWQLKRYNLLQTHHLMDLGELIGSAFYEAHDSNVTVHEGALRSQPEFLLHSVDEYMATLIQQISDEPTVFERDSLSDLQTIFVVCGYGQSRSIPYYIYLSPKVKENKIDKVCDYLPRYETLMSKDSAEMQTEKLVMTDLIHGN